MAKIGSSSHRHEQVANQRRVEHLLGDDALDRGPRPLTLDRMHGIEIQKTPSVE